MKNKLFPCLWFNGNAKQAAELYSAAFGNTKITTDTSLVVMFEISGCKIMGLNGGSMFAPNASISLFVMFEKENEIDAAWQKLSDGGSVFMPLNKYPWSEKYGWVQDKFGVSWQLMLAKPDMMEQKIIPALMFTQSVAGKAEEAMQFYTSLFPNSSMQGISRYEKGEGDPEVSGQVVEGTVKHGRFLLDGQMFVAMDSSMAHAFSFSEGVSISVSCETQEEIDHYWNKLIADGGQESMCGWLKDKYGVSWQIVPSILGKLMSDPGKGQRVMQALMQMKKLEIDKLENA
jgi:predicted 3-demethylubiquinone-9 3-methyltransferase (glyoxalase superfamily)